MWLILLRALRVAVLPSLVEKDVEKICELGEGFARSRNDILYRNSAWLYEEDFRNPTISVAINDDIHSYEDLADFFANERDANFAFGGTLVRVLLALNHDVETQSGVTCFNLRMDPAF